MEEITQNINDGMNAPNAEALPASALRHDGKVWQPVFLVIPQYDQDSGDEIYPARVGDANIQAAWLPVYDQGNEPYFQNIQNTLIEVSNMVRSMPYGNNRGWPGQATLTDTTETDLVAYPHGGPYALDLKTLIIDNKTDERCRVLVRPMRESATVYPFQCSARTTLTFAIPGVGPQGFGDNTPWTVQLESIPSSGEVIVSGFGVDVRTE